MNITTPHYEGFNNCNHIEELMLQLAKEIAEIQKDTNYNQQNETIIKVVSNETEEICSIECIDWLGQWINGVFSIKNYFPSYDFPIGVGVYPFNRSNLCDAFFHVAVFQQKQELSIAKNPQKLGFITWDITGQNTIGTVQQCLTSLTVTDLPIAITNQSDQTIIKAKPYLL